MNKLALGRAAMMFFLLAAVVTLGFAVKTYLNRHEIDARACVAVLFMLFFAVFSYNYAKKP